MLPYYLLGGRGCHAKDRGYIWGMNEKKVKVVSVQLLQKAGDSITASCTTQISGTKLRCQEDILPGIQIHIDITCKRRWHDDMSFEIDSSQVLGGAGSS